MTVPPVAPLTSRAQLVDALAVACELEHGLSLQYLFAAFSLRTDPAEWTDPAAGGLDAMIAVRRWAADIFFVAAQEMLHLAQAANLLLAVGGAPHLARPNFPQPPGTYPPDLGWELTAFSATTLQRFRDYESPLPVATASADPSGNDPIVPSRLTHESIGEMYTAIGHAFEHLDGLFVGRPDDQIPGWLVDFPQLVEVTDRTTARRAVTLIVDQGEGTPSDTVDSHYGIFTRIAGELAEWTERHPGFDPARPVASNPLAQTHPDTGAPSPDRPIHLVTDPATVAVQDVFTASYDVLVLALFRYFAGGRHDPAAAAVKDVVFGLMMTVIRPLGDLLTRLPMGPGYAGSTAGPSFETYPEIELLPHADAARILMADRLGGTAAAADGIARSGTLDRAGTETIAAVARRLDGFAVALRA